jgi:histone deacetylase 11
LIGMATVVYGRQYDIGLLGLERLHPFDTHKHSRAWKRLKTIFGKQLVAKTIHPTRPVRRDELLAVHSAAYLERLRDSGYLAAALEVPPIRFLPGRLIDLFVLRPMRWSTMGTVLASREAIRHGLAVSLSGGYHHAKPEGGEGFCIYSDIALAIHTLRGERALGDDDRVVYVDLDAHQGNGVCHFYQEDRRVFIFDMYNRDIYPTYDRVARQRIDCDLPLTSNCTESEYLTTLKRHLPGFLDSIGRSGRVGLAIYNAGSDVYAGDALGGLNVSAQGVLQRDRFVVDELRQRDLPVVMLPSGGYSRESYKLLADSVRALLE